jgi:hypothetical protein
MPSESSEFRSGRANEADIFVSPNAARSIHALTLAAQKAWLPVQNAMVIDIALEEQSVGGFNDNPVESARAGGVAAAVSGGPTPVSAG